METTIEPVAPGMWWFKDSKSGAGIHLAHAWDGLLHPNIRRRAVRPGIYLEADGGAPLVVAAFEEMIAAFGDNDWRTVVATCVAWDEVMQLLPRLYDHHFVCEQPFFSFRLEDFLMINATTPDATLTKADWETIVERGNDLAIRNLSGLERRYTTEHTAAECLRIPRDFAVAYKSIVDGRHDFDLRARPTAGGKISLPNAEKQRYRLKPHQRAVLEYVEAGEPGVEWFAMRNEAIRDGHPIPKPTQPETVFSRPFLVEFDRLDDKSKVMLEMAAYCFFRDYCAQHRTKFDITKLVQNSLRAALEFALMYQEMHRTKSIPMRDFSPGPASFPNQDSNSHNNRYERGESIGSQYVLELTALRISQQKYWQEIVDEANALHHGVDDRARTALLLKGVDVPDGEKWCVESLTQFCQAATSEFVVLLASHLRERGAEWGEIAAQCNAMDHAIDEKAVAVLKNNDIKSSSGHPWTPEALMTFCESKTDV